MRLTLEPTRMRSTTRLCARLCATVCWCASLAMPAVAQPAKARPRPSTPPPVSSCRPTLAQMREVVTGVWADTHDANAVLRKLDALIDYSENRVIAALDTRDGASVMVHFPSFLYRNMVMEALRKRDPLETLRVSPDVEVWVDTDRIDGPDIEKLIVERDGKTMVPRANAIRRVVKKTALGGTAIVHEGSASYSCEAFAPGATVVVTGITASGRNLELRFTSDELASYTRGRQPAPESATPP